MDSDLGAVPANVDVRAWFPQPAVLRHAAAFVSHAGMGSTMEALYYGVPLVCVPQMVEQEVNAARVAELGLGVRLDPEGLTADDLRAAVDAVTGRRRRCGPRSTGCGRRPRGRGSRRGSRRDRGAPGRVTDSRRSALHGSRGRRSALEACAARDGGANRAVLARQHLLAALTAAALDLLEHLVGLQAQEPRSRTSASGPAPRHRRPTCPSARTGVRPCGCC